MKLTIQKDDLIRVMPALQGVLGGKSMLPILSQVVVEGAGAEISLIASDLELWVSAQLPAVIEEEGGTTLPGRRFFNIARELPGTTVRLESGPAVARIRSGRAFYQMNSLPREEFPAPPKLDGATVVKIGQGQLKELIKKTAYAISPEDNRFVLNGLYLLFEKGELTAVATDGRRLAIARTECDLPEDFHRELILPQKTVLELSRILDLEGDCGIQIGERQVAFGFDGLLIVSRLIDGSYPNFRQIIPQEEGRVITLPRLETLEMIRRASLITDEKSQSVKLTFTPGQLKVSTVTPEVGEGQEELEIDYSGDRLEIAFNPFFILDLLKAIDEEETVKLVLNDSSGPGLFKTNDHFLCVIMPMKL